MGLKYPCPYFYCRILHALPVRPDTGMQFAASAGRRNCIRIVPESAALLCAGDHAMTSTIRRGCFLDTGTLGSDIDWTPLAGTLDHWRWHHHTHASDTAARIADASVIVTNKVVLDTDLLAAATQLELVCIAATGTDNVDLDAAAVRGIAVTNVRDYATPAVAQHVFALILA